MDIACPVGCAVGEAPLSAAPPLEPPALPATCSGGFEVNKPKKGSVYTITSKTPGGSSAAPLDVQIATYTAPDHMVIRATRKNGTTYPVVDTCTLKTALYSDPTGKGCVRPPEDSIRQYKVKLEAGTTKLEFDFAGACTPTYLRVLGLCEFEVTPFVPDCSFRTIK